MQTFLEYFASPDKHPLHNDAVKNGFQHDDTSSMAGTATHNYTHPKGHKLTLHTGSGGDHSFTMSDAKGKVHTGNTNMHFFGSRLKAGI